MTQCLCSLALVACAETTTSVSTAPQPAEPDASSGDPSADAHSDDRPAAASPSVDELAERHAQSPTDVELTRALVVAHVERGTFDDAWKVLEASLYLMAQAEALPAVEVWMSLVDVHFPGPEHLEPGTRYLSILRRYYHDEPDVYAALIGRVLDGGDTKSAAQLLDDARALFPEDDRFASFAAQLDESR